MQLSDVEHAFYINLASRPDRDAHMQEQLREVGLRATRFDAIKVTDGAVGCSLSHIKILSEAKARKLPYVLILEDDVCFLDPKQIQESFAAFFAHKNVMAWDVLLLGGNNVAPVTETASHWAKITKCQTTVAYMVNARYYDVLLQNFRQGCARLMQAPIHHRLFALDKFWFFLQEHGRWFILTPLTVTQMPGYSDIERRSVNYDRIMTTLDKSPLANNKLKPSKTLHNRKT